MLKLKISSCLQLWEKDSELLVALLKSMKERNYRAFKKCVYVHTYRVLMCGHVHLAVLLCDSKTNTMGRVEPVLKVFQ